MTEKKLAKLREEQMDRVCPELFEAKSVLVIGANKNRKMFLDRLVKKEKGQDRRIVDIVEGFGKNAKYLIKAYEKKGKVRNVIQFDVRSHLPAGPYDAILWYHGPEHVTKEELPDILRRLELRSKLVILGCPNGTSPQGPVDGNELERHVSEWGLADLMVLGYYGDEGIEENNVLAFKKGIC